MGDDVHAWVASSASCMQVGFSEPRFSSISQCCRRIWEEERAVGFLRGLLVSLDLFGALFLASGSIYADVALKFCGCMLTPGCMT